jgi:glycosyltransferase involved in cell wall biosynthesis
MARLLVLTSTLPASVSDGVPAFVLDIAREQAKQFSVTVLAPRVPGGAAHEIIDGVEIIRFPYFVRRWEDLAHGAILDNLTERRSRWLQVPFFVIAQAMAVRRAVRHGAVDAIHAHWSIPQGVIASLVAPRIPLVITTHGADLYALNRGIPSLLKRRAMRSAAHVTTVNTDMQSTIQQWGVSPERTTALPMGVSLTAALVTSVDRVPGRVTVVGRLVEKKGFAYLISALANGVEPRRWNLTVVGDGPLRSQLERQARGWGVTFAGQLARENVLAALAETEVFVLPSVTAASGDQEGLPVALLEAAAMGCAIVASDLPGINEALTDGLNALLVPPGDTEALAAAVDRLLRDPYLRARLGHAARARSVHYGIERIGAEYSKVVYRAIAQSTATIDNRHPVDASPAAVSPQR